MENLKVKIITGYDDEQHYTITADEAHKAYYLFRNPEKRGVFNNGLALVGKDIRAIQPDYHATMGWNKTHKMNADDWNEINAKGISDKLRDILSMANQISYRVDKNPELAGKSMIEIMDLRELKQIHG